MKIENVCIISKYNTPTISSDISSDSGYIITIESNLIFFYYVRPIGDYSRIIYTHTKNHYNII